MKQPETQQGQLKQASVARVKDRMYYPRTYRRFGSDSKRQILFAVFCMLPVLLLLLFFYPDLTRALSTWVIRLLQPVMPGANLYIQSGELIPLFGSVHYVAGLPTKYPDFNFSIINLGVTFALLWVCFTSKRKGKPLSIYFAMNLLIHLISCIYFAIVPMDFPYTATIHSELYLMVQVGVWITITVISGLVTGFLMVQGVGIRIAAFFCIVAYSLVFGCVRYLAFLYIVYTGSILYMPSLYFTLGPFYDFLYLVFLYSAFADIVINKTNTHKGRASWQWL